MKKFETLPKETINVDIKAGEFILIINKKKKLSVNSNITFENRNIINIAIDNNKRINNSFMSLIKVYLTSLNPIRSIGKQCSEAISNYTGLSLEESEFKLKEVLNNLLCPNTETIMKSLPRKLEAYEKQRLMFAIAFIVKPKLIVLDDTIFKMEPELKSYVLGELKKLKEENKTSLILISKKLDIINEIIDNIAIMYKGTIVEYGKKDLLLTDPIHPHTRYTLTPKDNKSLTETASKIADYVKDINKLPPTGCSFCLKCKSASYDCIYMAPKVTTISNDRQVICGNSTKIA
jgi:oligopeptide/dipeptide ABC transporter, ATP-binding protein, C-terminal domain